MEEVENDELLSGDDAYSYYQLLKKQNVGSWKNLKMSLIKLYKKFSLYQTQN